MIRVLKSLIHGSQFNRLYTILVKVVTVYVAL